MPTPSPRGVAAALLLCLAATAATAAGDAPPADLAGAEALVQQGRIDEALAILDRALAGRPEDAGAHLLRSTAHLLAGDLEAGRADLDRALALDPTLRQAWLNRAAIDLADEAYDEALAALLEAERLAPEEADNHLNIGAVLALQGRMEEADARFARYLALEPASAQAELLVASNLALAGHPDAAIAHLTRAVQLDERMRVRARVDPNFAALAERPDFQLLMSRDGYRPPPGTHTAERTFAAPFDHGRGRLLEAVLNAVQTSGYELESKIEVTGSWALIWSRFRIKVSDMPDGGGRVELSAPAASFDAEGWRRESDELLGRIELELLRLARSR